MVSWVSVWSGQGLGVLGPGLVLGTMTDTLSYILQLKGHTILAWNIRSIIPKIEEIDRIALLGNPEIMGICETWLTDAIDASLIEISWYNSIRADSTTESGKKSGGGLILYCKNSLKVHLQNDLTMCNLDVEMLWIELTKTRPIYYGLLCRPSTGSLDRFIEYLTNITGTLRGRGLVK